ncbi:MAG: type II secretion system F family protein, partial [Candidatus Contendobacter sp.]
PATRQWTLDAASRAPLLGGWLRQAEIGRWAALLGTLLNNRVELMRALELSGRGVRLSLFRDGLHQVGVAVRRGISLSQALAEHAGFDATSCNLVRVGERSGELPRMLQSLATLYAENGRQRMKRFLLLLEPAAILLIGGVIGLIMTGIILAIVTVNDIKI